MGELGESRLLAIADPIVPDEAGGSGSGGGLFEWPAAIGEFHEAGFAKEYKRLFPGDAKFVFGSQTNATMVGDRNAHILAGADLRVVVDLEAMATDALLGAIPGAGFITHQVAGALGGAGGSNAFICGPNNVLTYAGDQLSVVRGECYQLRSKATGSPASKVAKVLAVLVALATMAADIVAAGHLKHKQAIEDSGWERWAALGDTALSALPSRLLALLIGFETENAKVQGAALKADEAARMTAIAVREATRASTQAVTESMSLVQRAERRIKILIAEVAATASKEAAAASKEAANSAKVFKGAYSINAHDISLISQSEDLSGSDIHLDARGNAAGAQGSVLIQGSQSVSMGYIGDAGTLGATFLKTDVGGSIDIGNDFPGKIQIRQGFLPIEMGSPGITLSEEPPSIKLQVGLPEVGACLELTETGLTAKFGLNSITINELGIKLAVLENSIQLTPENIAVSGIEVGLTAGATSSTLTPASMTTSSPVVSVAAESAYSIESDMVEINGGAVVNVLGGLVCLN